MIEVRHLTKRYGDHLAADDLSFVVEDGTICGFLGPNGAGKSTTMNIMTGCLSPSEGDVLINGHDILDDPEGAKRTIGYLPENPPVYPDMTVYEYLTFVAELKKVPAKEREAQIETVIADLGLDPVCDRLIRNLSKGYRQRTGFAQALIGNPETLILDEPTAGLDPKQIIETRSLIRELGKTHTVILSSHILSEVAEVCSKVLIISEGRLLAADTPENLAKARHRTELVVTAEGAEEDVLRALDPFAGERRSGILDLTRESEGTIRVRLAQPAGEDIRGQISRALFEAGCPVVELREEKEQLEEIFLELTETGSIKEEV